MKSITHDESTNTPFSALKKRQFCENNLSSACHLHSPVHGCVGVAEVRKKTQWCYQEDLMLQILH